MSKSIVLIILSMLFSINAFALKASDIDMAPAIVDVTTLVVAVLSILILLFNYRVVINMLRS